MSKAKRNDEEICRIAKHSAERYFDTQMELLSKFCSIDCGTGNLEGNRKVVALVDAVLNEIGIEAEHIDAGAYGTHVVARIVPENPRGRIVLHAHLDTAFADGKTTVEDHPFRTEGPYAYGLGIADCKGGVAVILYAIKTLIEENLLPDAEIVMIFNADEEVGSPTGRAVFAREVPAADVIISFEPGRNKNGVLTFRHGAAFGTVKVHGIAVHAGLDGGTGASATRELANLIVKLTERSDLRKRKHYNFGKISGGRSLSIIPDYAEGEFYTPIDSNETFQEVQQDVLEYLPAQGIVDGCKIETEVHLEFPAMIRCEENRKVYKHLKEAADLLEIDLPEEASSNSADCCLISDINPAVVDGLGPYMYEIHTANEHMLMSSLKERTALLITALAKFEPKLNK